MTALMTELRELIDYLRQAGLIDPEETPAIEMLSGGVSNHTVLVTRPSGEAWVMKQALAKLRVKVDWFSDPARIHREAMGLRWLSKLAPAGTTTPLVFEDEARHLLAMQAVPQPHDNWKTLLLAGRVDRNHVAQFARLLGTIHRQAWHHAEQVSKVFDDRSFFQSLRVEPYYSYTGEQVPEASAFYDDLIRDTLSRRLTLVHGDYSPKNILVEKHAVGDRLVLIDHEVIHFGDPAFDLGFALAHLLSKAHHLPAHRTAFAQAAVQFWQIYRKTLGDVPWAGDLEPFAARHALGCLLARVAGRSTLEYLSDDERAVQRRVVVGLMADAPLTIASLVDRFVKGMDGDVQD